MTRLLLVMLFTGPMNEMPPGLNATVEGVEAGGWVAVGGTCVADVVVADVVVAVLPVAGCGVLMLVPEQAVIKSNIARTTVHTNIPWKRWNGIVCIILSIHLK
jgi:hypothetical protein